MGIALVTAKSGSSTFTFAQATNQPAPSFSAADVGKPIEIAGAGSAGGVLRTSVAIVISASQITTAANAASSFSAVGNAVMIGHDDTAVLNAAFAASIAQPVYVPCGIGGQGYRISGPLNLPAGGYVYGRITNPYYFLPALWSATTPKGPCNLIIADGFSSSWSGASGGIVLGGDNRVEGLAVSMMALGSPVPPPVYGKYPWVDLVHNFLIGGTYSIEADYGSGIQNQGWVIKDNDVGYGSVDCIRLNGSTDNIVTGNWAHGCANAAINLVGTGGTDVYGNVFENCGNSGVNIYGVVTNTHVVSNKIDRNAYWGVQIAAASGDVLVVGNAFYGNGAGNGGANWYFNGPSTITLTSVGNTYNSGSSPYQASANTGASLGAASTFVEAWPAGSAGTYSGLSQAIVQPKLLTSPNNLDGPYANDAAAAAAGLPLGAEYFDVSGVRRKRVS